MRSETLGTAAAVAKKLATASILSVLCLMIGAGCVLLPPALPLAIVALAGVLLLWALPDLYAIPGWLIVRFYFVTMFALICIPFYLAIVIPGLPWISINRTTGLLFDALFVVFLASSSRDRAYIAAVLRSWPLMFGILAVYLINMLVTTVISVQLATSVSELFNEAWGLWLPFLATVWLARTHGRIEGVLKLLVVCLFVVTVIGGIEFYLQRGFLLNLIPSDMRAAMIEQNPMLGSLATGASVLRNGMYRSLSVFTSNLPYAEFSAMAAPLAAYFLVHGGTPKARLFGTAGFVSAFASIVFSGSRGGYVGFLASLVVFGLLYAIRRSREHRESLAGMIALVVYAMGSAAALGAVFGIGRLRVYVLGNGATQASNDGRSMEWDLAMPYIYANPFGHGPGTAATLVNFISSTGAPSLDSYPINLLVDNGVIGLISFFAILLAMMWVCLQGYIQGSTKMSRIYLPLGCSLIAYTLYRFTLSQTTNNGVMLTFLACTFAIRYIDRSVRNVAQTSIRGLQLRS